MRGKTRQTGFFFSGPDDSTASRVGATLGIATALAAGGPGAVFWMWLMAGSAELLRLWSPLWRRFYKVRDGASYRGGPSYYIEQARTAASGGIVFSLALIACFAYGFNGLQSYNISSALPYYIPGIILKPSGRWLWAQCWRF